MIEIKNASPECAGSIASLASEIWNEYFTPIIGKAQVDYMLDKFQSERAILSQLSEGMKYIAAYSDGEPVGYSAYKLEPDAMFLSKIYVRRDKRGCGIGRKMFAREVEIAKDAGKDKIYLTVNKHNDDSIAIYRHLGFETEKSIVTDIGGGFVMDDYVMALRLSK